MTAALIMIRSAKNGKKSPPLSYLRWLQYISWYRQKSHSPAKKAMPNSGTSGQMTANAKQIRITRQMLPPNCGDRGGGVLRLSNWACLPPA